MPGSRESERQAEALFVILRVVGGTLDGKASRQLADDGTLVVPGPFVGLDQKPARLVSRRQQDEAVLPLRIGVGRLDGGHAPPLALVRRRRVLAGEERRRVGGDGSAAELCGEEAGGEVGPAV